MSPFLWPFQLFTSPIVRVVTLPTLSASIILYAQPSYSNSLTHLKTIMSIYMRQAKRGAETRGKSTGPASECSQSNGDTDSEHVSMRCHQCSEEVSIKSKSDLGFRKGNMVFVLKVNGAQQFWGGNLLPGEGKSVFRKMRSSSLGNCQGHCVAGGNVKFGKWLKMLAEKLGIE